MKEEEERTPLRTILQNFLNHIEKLDREKLEGSYDKEFQELKLFSEFLKTSKQYSCSQGEKEVNRKKNRYKDILPFDCSRVILEDYAGIPGSDYINANYIKGASGSPAYIASQGPLPHTVNDFWRMVVQCEVQVIVMACNEEESGKHKCENYWVEREGEEKQFGMVAIQLIKASVVCPDFLVRTMRLKYTKNHSTTQEERTVCQFHYSAWPDHGVPPLVRPLLDMVRLVRDTQASETLPVLVHCSAGCGRTGTICAIDYVWGLLRAGKLTKDFSLFKLVREMRKQRIAMVQTKEQYVLVHHAVKELFNEQLRMIDSHPYENIDVNGMVKESPEPVYATIKFDANNEEKQDSNEKECVSQESDDAPPLPCKRKPYTAHTKQEKEVENLTQKHRSSFSEQLPPGDCSSPGTSSSSSSTCGSLLHKPRIAKLRALFERTSSRDSKSVQVKHRTPQQVMRSHSLGAVRKVEEGVMCIQPIPNRGVLRVPQLAVTSDATYVRSGRPALPIKRSKSLKVLSSGERNKFSVPLQRGATAHECQVRDCAGVERAELPLSPKVSSLGSNKSVVNEVKPYVPPKKVTKDRFSDKKVAKNSIGECKTISSQNVLLSSRKGSEPVQLVNSSLLASEGWRRSLDSITLESDGAVPLSLPSSAQVAPSARKAEQYRLDEEAKKLLQDCRDYLSASEKCEPNKPNPERKFQNSLMTNIDSLQHLTVEAQRKVNAVVGGLGTRERRNSFRQAISKELESSVRPREYEPRLLNKSLPNSSSSSKPLTPSSSVDGKPSADASRMKLKAFPKPVVPNMSAQGPAPSHGIPFRAFRPKPRSAQKESVSSAQSVPPDDTASSSKVTCSAQAESPAGTGYVNHNERATSRWITRTDSSSGNSNSKLTENIYVKGQLESNVGARQDVRMMPPNSLHHQNKAHNPSRVPAHRSAEAHGEGPNEIRISSNPPVVNHEVCDYKNVNASVARRINTVSKGRFISPSSSNSKHFERSHVNESEPLSRAIYTEVPRLPQTLVSHEASHPLSAVNEPISINQETLNGIRNSRSAESHIPSSKILPKGESDPSTSMKHEVPNASGRLKDWPDKSGGPVGSNMLRRPEWSGQAAGGPSHPRTAVKQPWPPAGSGTHAQEHRFPNWVNAEPSGAPSRGTSGTEREELRGDAPGGERNAVAARVAPKLSVKQKKEIVINEGSGPSGNSILCGDRANVAEEISAPPASVPRQPRCRRQNCDEASIPKAGSKFLGKDAITEWTLADFDVSPRGATPLHHGSQDDLALCASGSGSAGSSRVRRHASVVLLRHSLIENSDSAPLSPLTVWNQPEHGESSADSSSRPNVSKKDLEAWNVAPGVDVDMVGASIKPSRDHGTALTRALEAFHFRKPSRGAAVSPPQQRKFPQAQQVFVKKQHYL